MLHIWIEARSERPRTAALEQSSAMPPPITVTAAFAEPARLMPRTALAASKTHFMARPPCRICGGLQAALRFLGIAVRTNSETALRAADLARGDATEASRRATILSISTGARTCQERRAPSGL